MFNKNLFCLVKILRFTISALLWGQMLIKAEGAAPDVSEPRASRAAILEQIRAYYQSQPDAKMDQINLKLVLDKGDLNILAFTKTNLLYSTIFPIMNAPEKYSEWVMHKINERVDGKRFFLEVNDFKIDVAKKLMDVDCLFQVLFFKFTDLAKYEFVFEPFDQGIDVAVRLIAKNQIVTEMTGNFMVLKNSLIDAKIKQDKAMFILYGQAHFLRVIAALLPMGWIQEELSERLDRMTQNLYMRAGQETMWNQSEKRASL